MGFQRYSQHGSSPNTTDWPVSLRLQLHPGPIAYDAWVMPLPRIFSSLKKKIAHFRLPCVCVTNANPISMKLGTVSLWCLCCGREMRYYNFISVVVIFPLKKKSVFLLSWTGPVKPDLFWEVFFFGKNPQEVQTDLTKSLFGSMVLLTNLQQV